MKKLLLLTFCLVAGASFGAYQYIISTDAELAVNPSETAYSAAVSVNAQMTGNRNLESALETRYRTFTESAANATILNRLKPGFTLILR